jgi:hypothetical protein
VAIIRIITTKVQKRGREEKKSGMVEWNHIVMDSQAGR